MYAEHIRLILVQYPYCKWASTSAITINHTFVSEILSKYASFPWAPRNVINEPDIILSPLDVWSYIVATVCTESIVSSLQQVKLVDQPTAKSDKLVKGVKDTHEFTRILL